MKIFCWLKRVILWKDRLKSFFLFLIRNSQLSVWLLITVCYQWNSCSQNNCREAERLSALRKCIKCFWCHFNWNYVAARSFNLVPTDFFFGLCGMKQQVLQIQNGFSDCCTSKKKVNACLLPSPKKKSLPWFQRRYGFKGIKQYLSPLQESQIQTNCTERRADLCCVFATIKCGIEIQH